MKLAHIQVSEVGKRWEEINTEILNFDNEADIAKFAYRLALITGKEVRVSNQFNNGQYFHPIHAKNYLDEN